MGVFTHASEEQEGAGGGGSQGQVGCAQESGVNKLPEFLRKILCICIFSPISLREIPVGNKYYKVPKHR